MGRIVEENGRYRLFFIELYHDTDTYNYEDVKRILKSLGKYAYITHKHDRNNDGTLKKVHDHWVVKLENAMSGRAFTKKTGIPLQFCQQVINERSCLRYLIHIDDDDKYKYKKEDVKTSGNYARTFNKAFQDVETEEEMLCKIYNKINDLASNCDNKHDALYYLIQYVNSNCYDTIYKRYRYELKDYLTSLY